MTEYKCSNCGKAMTENNKRGIVVYIEDVESIFCSTSCYMKVLSDNGYVIPFKNWVSVENKREQDELNKRQYDGAQQNTVY